MDRILKTPPILLEVIDYLDVPSLLNFRASCKAPYQIIDEYRNSILNGKARRAIPFRVMKYAPVERYPEYYRFKDSSLPETTSSTQAEFENSFPSTRKGEDLVILHPAGLYILWRRYLTAKLLSRYIPFLMSDSTGWGINPWDPFAFPLHFRLEEGFLVAFYLSDISKVSYSRTKSSMQSSSSSSSSSFSTDPFSPPPPEKRLSTWSVVKQHVNKLIDSSSAVDTDKYSHPPSTAESAAHDARISAASEQISELSKTNYNFATQLSMLCFLKHSCLQYGLREDSKFDYIPWDRDPVIGTSWLNWLILTEGPFFLASLIGTCDGYPGEEEWFEPRKEIPDVRKFVQSKWEERDENRVAMERESYKRFKEKLTVSTSGYVFWWDGFREAFDEEQRRRHKTGEKFEMAMDLMEEVAKGEWENLGYCEWEEADERYLKLQRSWFDAQVEVVKKRKS